MKTTGIILAGGKSSRMGKDKALLKYEGKSFLEHCATTLSSVCDEVLISANHSYPDIGLKVVYDIYDNKGPIGGIYAAMQCAKYDTILCLSVDAPLVTSEFLQWMLAHQTGATSVFVKEERKCHPLIAIYRKEDQEILLNQINNNELRMSNLIKKLNHLSIDAEDYPQYNTTLLKNINTPDEYKEIKSL